MRRLALVLGVLAGVAAMVDSAGAFAFLGDKWLDPALPMPYWFSTQDENCITGSEEFDEVRAGFQAWADIPGVRLSFVELGSTAACGHQTSDGKNTMSMEDCLDQLSGGVLASTSIRNWGEPPGNGFRGGDQAWVYNSDTGTWLQRAGFAESDIVFGDGWRFGTNEDISAGCCTDACGCSNAFDIRSIATHEIGHLIGLGHSDVGGATMFATVNPCNTGMATLHADDMAGATVLYDETYVPLDYKDLNAGNITVSLLNGGNVGASGNRGTLPGSYGSGFQWPGSTQNLFEAALIFGTGATDPVSDDVKFPTTFAFGQDNDFLPLSTVTLSGGGVSDQQAQTTFSDERAETPYGVTVRATMHAFATPPRDDFVILCYTLENTGASPINGLRVGFWGDWNFNGTRPTDTVSYDAVNSLGIITDSGTSNVFGMTALNPEGVQTFRPLQNGADYSSDALKAGYLFAGFTDTAESGDVNVLIATGDFDIAPGGSANAAFAFIGGTSVADVVAKAGEAQALYDSGGFCEEGGSVSTGDVAVPAALRLAQNVPNPFNPTTQIVFNLDRAGMVSLRIYDASGRAVRNLIEGISLPGEHEVVWDGRDDRGDALPSAMYFYTLEAGGTTTTRKMVLLK